MNASSADATPACAQAAVRARIATLGFTPRRESWVARSRGRFYKLARASDDPVGDWRDPACAATAAREYEDLRFLHRIAPDVVAPLERDQGCVVYPELSGPDLRDVLLTRRASATAGLHAAMRLLARVHAAPADLARYPEKPYAAARYLPPVRDVLERLAARPRTLCMEGFEVRNFRYDGARRAWRFFDPQVVSRGVAENDVARFLVSVLMVTWGADGSWRIFTAFDPAALVASYERAAGSALDRTLLAYFTHESIAMRRHFARRALARLHGVRRSVGRPYLAAYFHQLERWAHTHEF